MVDSLIREKGEKGGKKYNFYHSPHTFSIMHAYVAFKLFFTF